MRNQYLPLLAVSLPSFVYGIYRFSIGVAVPKIESAYAINDSTMGAIISASLGLIGIGVFLSGHAAEIYGPGSTLVSGLIIFLCPLVAIAFGMGFEAFTALLLLSSFGSGLMIPPSFSIIAVLLPQRRGIGAGLVTSAYNVGGLVGPATVGVFLLYYAWQSWFLVIALAAVASILVFSAALRSTMGRPAMTASKGKLLSLISDRRVQVLAIAAMLGDAGFVTYLSWTPKFLLTQFDVTGGFTAVVDLIYGLGFGMGALGIFVAGYLFEKMGGKRVAIIGGVAGGIGTMGVYLSGSLLLS